MQRKASSRIKSDDAEIVYWSLGEGPPVVLLHPFPANHEFWLPVAGVLATKYRVVLPDLRAIPASVKDRRRWRNMPLTSRV